MSDLTAEEHYAEANRLLGAYLNNPRQSDLLAAFLLAEAQVHSSMACALLLGMTTPGVSLGKDVPVR